MSESMSESGTTSHEDPDNYPPVTGDECYIYVIRERDTNYYKVGRTINPSRRLAGLQTGNPHQLIFKRIKKVDDQEWEKYVQDQLERYRIQGGGTEWFQIPIQDKHIIYNVLYYVPGAILSEDSVGEE